MICGCCRVFHRSQFFTATLFILKLKIYILGYPGEAGRANGARGEGGEGKTGENGQLLPFAFFLVLGFLLALMDSRWVSEDENCVDLSSSDQCFLHTVMVWYRYHEFLSDRFRRAVETKSTTHIRLLLMSLETERR